MRADVPPLALLALMAGPARAYQCPLLTRQLNSAVSGMRPDDPKVKQGKALIEQALRLHDGGNHDGALAETDEGAKVLRVRLSEI